MDHNGKENAENITISALVNYFRSTGVGRIEFDRRTGITEQQGVNLEAVYIELRGTFYRHSNGVNLSSAKAVSIECAAARQHNEGLGLG